MSNYPWEWTGAVRAELSWRRRTEDDTMLQLVFSRRDGAIPMPPNEPLLEATLELRDVVPESPTLDDEAVAERAERQLQHYYATKREPANASHLIARWGLAPKD